MQNMENPSLAEELGHLKNHVKYPASRAEVVSACNNMSDMHATNAAWFAQNLPEGNYNSPHEVLGALLKKV
jgi:hypothetical protein